jgi:(2S)-methylsuccinyl-CoA dehydrogenase
MLTSAAPRETGLNLLAQSQDAAHAAEALLAEAKAAVRRRVMVDNRPVDRLFDREQRATHGLAWLATYVEAIRQLAAYAERMRQAGTLGEMEKLIVHIGIGEYLAQIQGGIPMSQGEMLRPADLGLSGRAIAERLAPMLDALSGGDAERRARLVELMRQHHDATVGECGLDDTLVAIREEMRKFADTEVKPYANDWHKTNSYIPLEVVAQMSELGVFGLTIGEDYGGLGLGKESMCVVSEELSRGYIGVG